MQAGWAARLEGAAAGGPWAATLTESNPAAPSLSVTASLQVKLPALWKTWVGLGADEWGLPSPKSQSYPTTVPSGS